MRDILSTLIRLVVGLAVLALGVAITIPIMILLLPWRLARIKVGNAFGKTVGRTLFHLTGCPLTVQGAEHLDGDRPAIYVSNHTSIVDIFLAIWLSPWGTVGVAKREVVWYPFFGQAYFLSGHLRIDRGRTDRAKRSMAALGEMVRDKGLSIFLWPEGTRSRDGRLLPLKKGLVYLAVQTGLPVVPLVVTGAHRAWEKHSLSLSRVPVEVRVLPAIDTSHWDTDDVDTWLAEVRERFVAELPDDQRPLPGPASKAPDDAPDQRPAPEPTMMATE